MNLDKLDATSSIRVDTHRRQLQFVISGFWELEEMSIFLKDLAKAAHPLIEDNIGYSALGDLSAFVPQDRATADAIRDSLLLASRHGLKRFAVVSPPPLVKMQYRRIAAGLDVEFFDDQTSASRWLSQSN